MNGEPIRDIAFRHGVHPHHRHLDTSLAGDSPPLRASLDRPGLRTAARLYASGSPSPPSASTSASTQPPSPTGSDVPACPSEPGAGGLEPQSRQVTTARRPGADGLSALRRAGRAVISALTRAGKSSVSDHAPEAMPDTRSETSHPEPDTPTERSPSSGTGPGGRSTIPWSADAKFKQHRHIGQAFEKVSALDRSEVCTENVEVAAQVLPGPRTRDLLTSAIHSRITLAVLKSLPRDCKKRIRSAIIRASEKPRIQFTTSSASIRTAEGPLRTLRPLCAF